MADDLFEHAMGDADALMWNIERDPHLRSPIVVLLVLDRAPKWKRVLERLERGTRLIPRMRQRVVEPAVRVGPPAWSADPDFDLAYHARRIHLPKGSSFDAVLELAERAAMGDFDRARPLWEYTLVEGLPKGRAAFVLKVHHSMTDGVGGMRLLMMLFDLERKPPPDGPEPEAVVLPVFSPTSLIGSGIAWQARHATDTAQRIVDVARTTWQRVRDDAAGALDEVTSAAGSVARFLAPAAEPCSPLINARSLDRRVSVLRVPLDDLKRAASAAGGTLNDAFVAGVVGGLQRYHSRHDSEIPELRMIMPINLRGESAALGGNHFTPARLLVPLDIDDPVERLRVIGERCRELRAEPAVALSETVAGLLNRLPRRAATLLFGSMLKGADFVTSNVPGSPFPLYLCGAEVDALYAFAPLSGTAANVALLSHCGTCYIGINTDPRAIPDTKRFKKSIRRGLREVLALS
ncbi:MAG: wax ester/triacylglycerol synthase family O-acyltransferase [Acidimicrobiia bacterium]